VCDVGLSTGALLYSCGAGGFGFTKEKFIVDLHNFFGLKSCVSILRDTWVKDFDSGQSEAKYIRQKAEFNSKRPRVQSWSDCARLICLLTASGYAYKYQNKSYVGSYFPYAMDFTALQANSDLARLKSPNVDSADLFSFEDSRLDDNTLAYFHMPGRFDRYGYNYVWSRRKMTHTVKAFNELNELGKKVCVSTLYESRGLLVHEQDLFPGFNRYIVDHSNDNKYGFNRRTSEIYYVNF